MSALPKPQAIIFLLSIIVMQLNIKAITWGFSDLTRHANMRKAQVFSLAGLICLYSALGFCNPPAEAVQSLRAFFAIDHSPITFNGLFVDTPAEYGALCELMLDLSSAASGYISLRGEYAPKNSAGEGIYFADAEYKLAQVSAQSIVLSQKISDEFGNDATTELSVSKRNGYWLIDLTSTRSFWWLTDSVSKHCKLAMTD